MRACVCVCVCVSECRQKASILAKMLHPLNALPPSLKKKYNYKIKHHCQVSSSPWLTLWGELEEVGRRDIKQQQYKCQQGGLSVTESSWYPPWQQVPSQQLVQT